MLKDGVRLLESLVGERMTIQATLHARQRVESVPVVEAFWAIESERQIPLRLGKRQCVVLVTELRVQIDEHTVQQRIESGLIRKLDEQVAPPSIDHLPRCQFPPLGFRRISFVEQADHEILYRLSPLGLLGRLPCLPGGTRQP